MIFAHGSRFGGHALYVKDGHLTYTYNFLGIPPEKRISAPISLTGRHLVGVEFTKQRLGEHREGIGPLRLYIGDEVVGEEEIRTVLGHFSLCGEGLCIGYDSGDAVSADYAGSRFEFTGGEIVKVVFDIADDAYPASSNTSPQQRHAIDAGSAGPHAAGARASDNGIHD